MRSRRRSHREGGEGGGASIAGGESSRARRGGVAVGVGAPPHEERVRGFGLAAVVGGGFIGLGLGISDENPVELATV